MCIRPFWGQHYIRVYIVFYAGSTSSSLCDHWINRLPGSRPASLASGASSRRTSLASLAESVEFPVERSEDDGEAIFTCILIFVLIYLTLQIVVLCDYMHMNPSCLLTHILFLTEAQISEVTFDFELFRCKTMFKIMPYVHPPTR